MPAATPGATVRPGRMGLTSRMAVPGRWTARLGLDSGGDALGVVVTSRRQEDGRWRSDARPAASGGTGVNGEYVVVVVVALALVGYLLWALLDPERF